MIRIFNQYVSAKVLLLAAVEAALLATALICGVRIRFWNSPEEIFTYIQYPTVIWQFLTFIGTFQLCFYFSDLYNLSVLRRRQEHLVAVVQAFGAASVILGVLYYVLPDLLIGRGVFFISIGFAAMFLGGTHIAVDMAWRAAMPGDNVLILGTGALAATVRRELERRADLNIRVAGFVESGRPADAPKVLHAASGARSAVSTRVAEMEAPSAACDGEILGTAAELEAIVARESITRIIVALEDRRGALPTRDLVTLRVQGLRVEDAHSAIAALTGRVWLDVVRPSWFLFSEGFRRSRFTIAVKRIGDIVFGLLGLVLSLPIMAVVAIAVRVDSPGPVIFRQKRVGLSGRIVEILKFRSMRVDAEQKNGAQWAQENDPRVTRVGRFIRTFRLDELPQFVNVIRGEMSFVGPRPERPEFVRWLREQIPYYDERHSVRPGITGWAQVQYHYGATIEDSYRKVEYDLFYLKNMSLLFDLVIVWKTIRIVMTGSLSR